MGLVVRHAEAASHSALGVFCYAAAKHGPAHIPNYYRIELSSGLIVSLLQEVKTTSSAKMKPVFVCLCSQGVSF